MSKVEEIVKTRQRVKLVETEIKVSELSLFRPKSARALFEDYPELSKYPESKELHSQDLLFCYYYACESSPIYQIRDKKGRAKEAILLAYESINYKSHGGGNSGGKKLTLDEKYDMGNCKFSEKMSAGIKMFSRFRINPRIRAKMMTEKAFENLEKILDIDASDDNNFKNKDGDVDFSKKKSYVDTVARALTVLPELIDKLESSFSVSSTVEQAKDSDGDDISFADLYHDLNK
jgi:hypothetical protein